MDVEVVGRLVEQQAVDRAKQELGERQPVALPARQDGGRLLDGVPAEEKRAEEVAQPRHHVVGCDRHHLIEDVLRGIEDVRLVLREVAELDVVADLALAGGERLDAGEQLHERGLAGAVRSDERDALAALEREVEPLVDDELFVALAGLAELEHDPAAARRGREADVELLRPRRDFQPLELLELLDAALDELRLRCLVAETCG